MLVLALLGCGVDPTLTCEQLVDCARVATPDADFSRYAEDGECWTNKDLAASCHEECRAQLPITASQAPDEPTCQGVPGVDYGDTDEPEETCISNVCACGADGPCTMTCNTGFPCAVDCDGDCTVDCHDNPDCQVSGLTTRLILDCSGGNCNVDCETAGLCEVDCANGDCNVMCPVNGCRVKNCDTGTCTVGCGNPQELPQQDGPDLVCAG